MDDYIRFSCEHCDFKVKTPSKNAGNKGRCPNCKELSAIPEKEIEQDKEQELTPPPPPSSD